jgi:hypothetical protein
MENTIKYSSWRDNLGTFIFIIFFCFENGAQGIQKNKHISYVNHPISSRWIGESCDMIQYNEISQHKLEMQENWVSGLPDK